MISRQELVELPSGIRGHGARPGGRYRSCSWSVHLFATGPPRTVNRQCISKATVRYWFVPTWGGAISRGGRTVRMTWKKQAAVIAAGVVVVAGGVSTGIV